MLGRNKPASIQDGLRTLTVVAASCLAAVVNTPAHAQSTANQPPATTIFTRADEVSLDLFVQGKKHKPVLDLTPQDLTVTDSGVPVRLASLSLVGPDSGSRLLTLVFDRLDSTGGSTARRMASKIMKEVPGSGYTLSVLQIQGQLRLEQAFTSDQSLITQAIAKATQGPLHEAATSDAEVKDLLMAARRGRDAAGKPITREQRLRAEVLIAALQDSQSILREQHPDPSLAGLLALVRSERRLPGLKVIFFITQNSASAFKDRPMLARIVSSANRAGVSIFVLDADTSNEENKQYLLAFSAMREAMSMKNNLGVTQTLNPTTGPLAGMTAAPPDVQAPSAPTGSLGDIKTPDLAIGQAHYDSLDLPNERQSTPVCELANDTGGTCITAGGNPQKAVHRLVEDMASYYEASFVPADKQYDGKFHAIKVKTVRHGLKVKSRSGYFALPPESKIAIQAFEVPLLNVLTQSALPHALQFDSRIVQFGDLGDGDENAVVVEVPISQVETHDDPNTNLYSAHVSILAQIKDKSGQIVQHFAEDVPQHGSFDKKQAGDADSIRLQQHFIADPGEYVLEVAVLDRNSGKIAAQRSGFEITDASRVPFLSDLSLVARMDPLPEIDATGPLRYGDARVVPELSSDVPRTMKQISIFSIVHPDAQSKEQPRLDLKLVRDGESLAQSPMQLPANQQDASVPYLASIQTSALAPGNYQVIEILTQGKSVQERSAAFRIAGPEFASAGTPTGAAVSVVENNEAVQPASASAAGFTPKGIPSPLIAALPSASVNRPSPEVIQAIVAATTKFALNYSKSLPNFVCMEVTKRSADNSGRGNWKLRDTFAELLRYDGHGETRTMLERNGQRASGEGPSLDSALPTSVGQFGGLLNLVFRAASKTSFTWNNAAVLGTDTLQVLRYVVTPDHATMGIRSGARMVNVGFHGLLYVDAATGGIRRITLEADNVPHDFPIHATSMVVDYSYVTIGSRDYLLPSRAAVSVVKANRKSELNEIAFRNYRRFASKAKIVPVP